MTSGHVWPLANGAMWCSTTCCVHCRADRPTDRRHFRFPMAKTGVCSASTSALAPRPSRASRQAGLRRCFCLVAIATMIELCPIRSLRAADVVPMHQRNGSGRVALLLVGRCESGIGDGVGSRSRRRAGAAVMLSALAGPRSIQRDVRSVMRACALRVDDDWNLGVILETGPERQHPGQRATCSPTRACPTTTSTPRRWRRGEC